MEHARPGDPLDRRSCGDGHGQRIGEQVLALAIVPRHVITVDGVAIEITFAVHHGEQRSPIWKAYCFRSADEVAAFDDHSHDLTLELVAAAPDDPGAGDTAGDTGVRCGSISASRRGLGYWRSHPSVRR